MKLSERYKMALIHMMLGTAAIYLEAGEKRLARAELQRALNMARGMRDTRKCRILRAYIIQSMEAL